MTDEQWVSVQNGGWLKPVEMSSDADRVVLTYHDDAKAIYARRDDVYKPEKNDFNEVGGLANGSD
ncbi:hypothetical protein [Limosilactobacillus equigenerosi]|uniref:hypothetical protein n=1 Tax=Limosilactobacillus equigenerosi TaxID=417373 RepID=UPI000B31FF53|nr:hypothetical protein [Limosilactobacillus equigenerosi]